MRIKIMALALLLATAAAAGAAGEAPLAKKVPENTLLYVGWAGRSLTFDGSLMGQLLAEPDVKRLCGAIHDGVSKALAEQEEKDQAAAFKHLWAMGKIAWQHPLAVALFDVELPAAGGEGGPPRPVGAVLIDLGKDRPAFEGELQGLLAVARENAKITQATIGDVTYHTFDTPAGPCGLGLVGDLFFVTVGAKAPETVVALAGGKARSLAGAPAFVAAMKDVCGETVQSAWYVDVTRACDLAEKLAPPPATQPAGPSEFRKAVKALGLERVTAMAGAVNIVERNMHERSRIFSPAPHRGLLMPLAGGALPAGALAGVPADADFLAVGRLDCGKLLAEVRRAAGEIDPKSIDQLNGVLEEIKGMIGADLEKEVLAHLGDRWLVCHAESLGGMLTGTVLSVSVKDPVAFAAVLKRLEGTLAETLDKPGLTVRTMKAGQLEIRYVAAARGKIPVPVAPAWALHKGRLYLAAFPQVVLAAVTGVKEKPLAESPEFVALRKRVSGSASALMYVNTPRILRRFYGVGLVGWTALANALVGEVGPVVSPEMFPSLPKIEKYVRPGVSAISSDEKGIIFESYGSLSGMGFLWGFNPLQMIGGVGTAIPALGKARGNARRAVSMANLHAIGMGCQLYMVDKEAFPPDLNVLIKDNILQAEHLCSPITGSEPVLGPDKLPIGPGDYVYLGGSFKGQPPGNLILAYEPPEHFGNKGAIVLRTSGGVQWVDVKTFQLMMKRTREYIQKQNQKK